jgi:lipoic acid synthetase
VYNHNVETVRRFQSGIRPQASYGRSLSVLQRASAWSPAPVVKSGLMLGLGETDEELDQALQDLRSVGCELLTLGQYLQPTRHHAPVARYVTPEEFDAWARRARDLGFSGVASAPLVRSSYRADALLGEALKARRMAAIG